MLGRKRSAGFLKKPIFMFSFYPKNGLRVNRIIAVFTGDPMDSYWIMN